MTKTNFRSATVWLLAGAGLALVALLGGVRAQSTGVKATEGSKYIGADKCKTCHSVEANGDQFGHWSKTAHAKAFETLASDAAKKIATEKGVADAQAGENCTKCHVTAFGAPAEMLKAKPEKLHGVQCEVCHGPGEKHMKARLAATAKAGDAADPKVRQEVPAGEIVVEVTEETCKTCHNAQSPTFKPFCFHERSVEIAHLDPRKEHKGKRATCSCDKCKAGCPEDHGVVKK
jgi:hypothetical protein